MEINIGLLIVLFIVVISAIVILYIKNKDKQETINFQEGLISTRDKQLEHKMERIDSLNSTIVKAQSLTKSIEQELKVIKQDNIALKNTVYIKEKDLLKNICFKLDNGEIAANVKVKTTINKNGKILKVSPTVRRYINKKYQEIPVTIHFSN